MSGLSWLKRLGPFHIATRPVGDWHVVEFRGRFAAGEPQERFLEEIGRVLQSGARRIVVDFSAAKLGDESVASAANDAYHQARAVQAEMRFVVQPGRAGGFYHMAGLEMTIPTYAQLTGAIEL